MGMRRRRETQRQLPGLVCEWILVPPSVTGDTGRHTVLEGEKMSSGLVLQSSDFQLACRGAKNVLKCAISDLFSLDCQIKKNDNSQSWGGVMYLGIILIK